MSFLLDTNICSAHIRRPGGVAHHFVQHAGRLWMPTIVLRDRSLRRAFSREARHDWGDRQQIATEIEGLNEERMTNTTR